MSWYQEAMKEAEDCHKLREAVNQAMIRRFPNGETHSGRPRVFLFEYIEQKSERRELKHLSNVRKRKRSDSLSSGERNGMSLNLCHVITCACCAIGVVGCTRSKSTDFELYLFNLVEQLWNGRPKRVTAS